jgi:hypothetical protein
MEYGMMGRTSSSDGQIMNGIQTFGGESRYKVVHGSQKRRLIKRM